MYGSWARAGEARETVWHERAHKDAMVFLSHKGAGWTYSGDVPGTLGKSSGHRRPVYRKVEDAQGSLSGRPWKILS